MKIAAIDWYLSMAIINLDSQASKTARKRVLNRKECFIRRAKRDKKNRGGVGRDRRRTENRCRRNSTASRYEVGGARDWGKVERQSSGLSRRFLKITFSFVFSLSLPPLFLFRGFNHLYKSDLEFRNLKRNDCM